jgi:hypothetical protein
MAAIPAIKRYEGSGTVAVLKVISPQAAAGPGNGSSLNSTTVVVALPARLQRSP